MNFNPGPDPRSKIQDSAQRVLGEFLDLGSWIRARIEIQSLNPVSIRVTVPPSFTDLVYVSVCVCVCVCLLNVGVFTREDRHTDDMKKQTGRDCTRRAQNRQKSVDLWGGEYHIYIYMYIYMYVYIYIYIYSFIPCQQKQAASGPLQPQQCCRPGGEAKVCV